MSRDDDSPKFVVPSNCIMIFHRKLESLGGRELLLHDIQDKYRAMFDRINGVGAAENLDVREWFLKTIGAIMSYVFGMLFVLCTSLSP